MGKKIPIILYGIVILTIIVNVIIIPNVYLTPEQFLSIQFHSFANLIRYDIYSAVIKYSSTMARECESVSDYRSLQFCVNLCVSVLCVCV